MSAFKVLSNVFLNEGSCDMRNAEIETGRTINRRCIFLVGVSLVMISFLPTAVCFSDEAQSTGLINALLWSKESDRLLVAEDTNLYWWKTQPLARSELFGSYGDFVMAIAANATQSMIAYSGWDGEVRLWYDSASANLVHKRFIQAFKVTDALSTNVQGNFLALGDCQGVLQLITTSGVKKWSHKVGDKCVTTVAFSDNGSQVAFGNDNGKIGVFDVKSGRSISATEASNKGIGEIVFHPSGLELISAGKDGRIIRWSYPELRREQTWDGFSPVFQLDITSDGRFLISGDSGGRILVRDIVDGRLIGQIELGPTTRVTAMAVSPDGKWLAYAGSDHSLHIHDMYDFEGYAAVNSQPCDLYTSVSFDDANTFDPNGKLDGAETEAFLTTTVTNRGAGPAFGVAVSVSCSNPDIQLQKTQEIVGPMTAGQTEVLHWPVSAVTRPKDGVAPFLVVTSESEKRDAPRVRLDVPVSDLKPPRLILAGAEWNDGVSGEANGNNNGVPENGETIELSVFIQNSGLGRAKNTWAKLEFSPQQGLSVTSDSVSLGHLDPGQIVPATFQFSLQPQYSSNALSYTLIAEDERDLIGLRMPNQQKSVNRNVPILTASIRAPDSITNDSSFVLQIDPHNVGTLSAEQVMLTVSIPGTNLESGEQQSVGTILPGDSGGRRYVRFDVPRTLEATFASIRVSLTQGLGFSDYDTTINIPVRHRATRLTAELLSSKGGLSFQQGTKATLQLLIRNEGDLRATGVSVFLESGHTDIRLQPTRLDIGTIPARQAAEIIPVIISVPGGATSGSFDLTVGVEQSDFSRVTRSFEGSVFPRPTEIAELNFTPQAIALVEEPPISASSDTGVVISYYPEPGKTPVSQNPFRLQTLSLYSPIGIANFQVTVNGKTVYDDSRQEAQILLRQTGHRNLSLADLRLPLEAGVNSVHIQAREIQTNRISTAEFRLVYETPVSQLAWIDRNGQPWVSDVDVNIGSDDSDIKNPNRCAIVIGIERYLNAAESKFSKHDAECFAEYARHLLGVPDENVFALYNDGATYSTISDMFTEGSRVTSFLDKHKGEAEVFLFYSGHGVPNYSASSDSLASSYILPYDVAPTHEKARKYGLSVGGILKALQSHSPHLLCVAFDACFMGRGRNGEMLAEQRPAFREPPVRLSGNGEVSMYATAEDETAIPYPEKYHGLFTYFLLKGLRGEADNLGNHDKKVTVGEIRAYVEAQVPGCAQRHSSKQTPQITTGNPDLVLVELK